MTQCKCFVFWVVLSPEGCPVVCCHQRYCSRLVCCILIEVTFSIFWMLLGIPSMISEVLAFLLIPDKEEHIMYCCAVFPQSSGTVRLWGSQLGSCTVSLGRSVDMCMYTYVIIGGLACFCGRRVPREYSIVVRLWKDQDNSCFPKSSPWLSWLGAHSFLASHCDCFYALLCTCLWHAGLGSFVIFANVFHPIAISS